MSPNTHLSSTRRLTPFLVALLLVVVGSSGAPAQFAQAAAGPERHFVRVGFEGGVVVPTSDAANALKTGVHGQGFLLLNLAGFPLRLALGYQHFDLKQALTNATTGTGTTGSTTTGTSTQLGGIAGTQFDLFQGPVRPYILAGVGGFNINDVVNTPSGQTSASAFKFGIDGGAGLALSLGRLSAFVEGRVQNVYTNSGGLINTKSIQSIPVSFGILF